MSNNKKAYPQARQALDQFKYCLLYTSIPSTLHKIARLRAMAEKWKPDLLIQVECGINAATCESVIQAGANVLVVGSAIFDGVDPEGNVRKYKALLERRED